jgi:hypothetical protein
MSNTRRINTNALLKKKLSSTNRILINKQQNDITNLIINQQLKDNCLNQIQFAGLIKKLEASRPIEVKKAYETRDNTPYKNILPPEAFKKNIQNKDDLIIYRVTSEDKNKIVLKKKITEINNTRKIQNNELEQTYNQSNKKECEKKFNYNNTMRYNVDYNQPNYDSMKNNVNDYYKKQQNEVEQNKKSVDTIIEDMMNTDIYDN